MAMTSEHENIQRIDDALRENARLMRQMQDDISSGRESRRTIALFVLGLGLGLVVVYLLSLMAL
ncbi:hypothetical protein [Vannielia litorea]|uniref:hypothetical protein n=1 Tax=Vannielia TaxID=2813041 RepID=UPI001C95E9D8|nr:hypothetical protein [Vannielia litorea]MBY6049866.1 hypothetical protein [Vannielia litorea]MBY6077280.1 hypothetical protein [Vannielia litorea]